MSASSTSPFKNSMPVTASPPAIRVMRLSTWTSTPSSRIGLLQQGRSGSVELPRHEPRRDLDHVGFEAGVQHRSRGFQPQEAPADHRRAPGLRRVREDGLEVLDRAVHEDAALVDARDRRHEGRRTGGEDEDVVGELGAVIGRGHSARAVHARHAAAEAQVDPVVLVPSAGSEEQRVRRALREVAS